MNYWNRRRKDKGGGSESALFMGERDYGNDQRKLYREGSVSLSLL